jgi:uncharacterized membrane protein YhaH (DUF805 family)
MRFLRVCFGFSGRMSRSEYTIMFFGSMIALIAGFGLAVALIRELGEDASTTVVISLVAFIAACKWVVLAALAKRLHDVGASGGLCLLAFVPLLGTVLAVVMFFVGGTDSDNRYGPQTYLFRPRLSYAGLQSAA